MIEFEVKSRVMPIGPKKGETVYYAAPKSQPKITAKQVEDEIVRATSLTRGDVRNALATFAEIVNSALANGASVDLGDLGSLKVEVTSSMESSAKAVTSKSLKTPTIKFFPKQAMLDAAKSVKVKVIGEK
ncbi:hypothetical protein HW49_00335 [Porphyromonadaceae bacterium COT-184 OH4590]|nr:hypothetical protein HW49_00335 [Porphyromonadaceae bacterium COT-184 OH4590]MDO4725723.1 HU family DNA-binding protein [Porphyromonadaceae bacterium]